VLHQGVEEPSHRPGHTGGESPAWARRRQVAGLARRMVAGRGVEEEAELGSADEQVLAGAEIWTKVTYG
jgi:hypothetical protein